jgi:hypothetical protein
LKDRQFIGIAFAFLGIMITVTGVFLYTYSETAGFPSSDPLGISVRYVYPYALPGTILIIFGPIMLIVGILVALLPLEKWF